MKYKGTKITFKSIADLRKSKEFQSKSLPLLQKIKNFLQRKPMTPAKETLGTLALIKSFIDNNGKEQVRH